MSQATMTEQEYNDIKEEHPAAPRRLMDDLLRESATPPEPGSLIEGRVLAKDRLTLYVDVIPFGTGIIFGREFLNARDLIKKINPGDLVTAKVITAEGENGYWELSLKEAKQALVWN